MRLKKSRTVDGGDNDIPSNDNAIAGSIVNADPSLTEKRFLR
jgi:hypothetical protein